MLVLKRLTFVLVAVAVIALFTGPVLAAKPSLDKWKPDFDPSTAKYKFKVSNVSHPALKGVYAGFCHSG